MPPQSPEGTPVVSLPFKCEAVLDATIDALPVHDRVEDALRESEEKLSKILHGSSNAMSVTTMETGRIVDATRA